MAAFQEIVGPILLSLVRIGVTKSCRVTVVPTEYCVCLCERKKVCNIYVHAIHTYIRTYVYMHTQCIHIVKGFIIKIIHLFQNCKNLSLDSNLEV